MLSVLTEFILSWNTNSASLKPIQKRRKNFPTFCHNGALKCCHCCHQMPLVPWEVWSPWKLTNNSKMMKVSVPDAGCGGPCPLALPAVPRLRSTATQSTQKKMRIVNVHSGWNSRKGELLMALFVTRKISTANFILFLRTKIKMSRTAWWERG